MKRRLLTALATMGILLGVWAAPALASSPCPSPGPEFGRHVSGMVPGCIERCGGAMVGECISFMARGSTCQCTH